MQSMKKELRKILTFIIDEYGIIWSNKSCQNIYKYEGIDENEYVFISRNNKRR